MNNSNEVFFTKKRFLALILSALAGTLAIALWAEISQPVSVSEKPAKSESTEPSKITVQQIPDTPVAVDKSPSEIKAEADAAEYKKDRLSADSQRLEHSNASCESDGNIITAISHGSGNVLLPGTSKGVSLSFVSSSLKAPRDITSLEFPESVSAILSADGHFADTSGAFYGNPTLSAVLPSENLMYIGNKAFYACPELTNVFFPKGLLHIGEWAFYDCNKLNKISVHGNTAIDDGAFAHCDSLSEVYLSGNVTRVGLGAFEHTEFYDSLTDEFCVVGDILLKYNGTNPDVVIPDGVRIIADGVFAGKFTVKKVTVPKSVSYIGNSAFRGCFRMEYLIFDRESPPVIGENAVDGCPLLNADEVSSLTRDSRDMFLSEASTDIISALTKA